MESFFNDEMFWKINVEKDKMMKKIQEDQEAAKNVALQRKHTSSTDSNALVWTITNVMVKELDDNF